MSLSPSSTEHSSTNGAVDKVELLVSRFESLWFQGQRPSLDVYLTEAGAARRTLLIELVHTELELRLKAGEAARVEEYLQRYPELSEDPAVEWDLIAAEYRVRLRRESGLSLDEYRCRFARWETQLGHLATSSQSLAGTPTAVPSQEITAAPTEWPVIPGLEVLGELGRGGMGIVYQVRQTTLKRLAAVKVLRPGAGVEERRRFRTEAEAAARLRHPNIAQIHEVGEEAGQPYLVLEYAEGGSLAQRLDGTPWPIRDAAELVRLLAEAVQYAHHQGVLHRDLSPANVLLDSEGRPKICDFGLAKLVIDAGTSPTRTEAVLGTPSYMSPEQASGRTRQVGPTADVYGLGSILYELLTGRPPFKGESSLDTIRQVLTDEPVPPHRLRSTVPPDLETICLKCLQKKATERYLSASDLADDLRRFLAGDPIKARPPSHWRLAGRWMRKHPAATSLLAAGLVLIFVVVFGSLWHSVQLSQALEDTKKEHAKAIQSEHRARQTQYASDMRVGFLSLKGGDVFALDPILARLEPRSQEDEDVRGFEWRYLSRFRQSAPIELRAHQNTNAWLAYSPDGRLLATARDDEHGRYIRISNAATKEPVSKIFVKQSPFWLGKLQPAAFSPADSSWLAVCDGNTVNRWDPWTGQKLGKPLVHKNGVHLVAISFDGKQIITAGDGPVTIWDVSADKPPRCLPASSHVSSMALMSNGRTLITQQKNDPNPYKAWDLSTGGDGRITTDYGKLFSSPRGTILGGVIGNDTQVILNDVASGYWHEPWLHSGIVPIICAAISPDDKLLALAYPDGGVRFFDIPTRRPRGYLRWQTRTINRLSFSADGETLAVSIDKSGDVYQVQIPEQQDPDTLHPTGVIAPFPVIMQLFSTFGLPRPDYLPV